METTYKIALARHFEAGLVTVGRFDGKHPAVAAASGACGQVLLYDPHDELQVSSDGAPPLRTLNFNKTITALDAGPLDPTRTRKQSKETRGVEVEENDETMVRDVLLVGLGSALMVYDVDLNSDVFYRECPDGVLTCTFAVLSDMDQPLVVVGGNCSVVGFGWQGTELFWNVAGDHCRAVAAAEGDLLVGSDDYEIRLFRKEEALYEISEADKVIALCGLGKRGRFAFGLNNGTVGVYKNKERRWRVKSKNKLVALLATECSGSLKDVCAGWSSGAVTLRSASNGQVLFKDAFDAPLCALARADLRLSGSNQLIAVSSNGDIRGYQPASVKRDTSKAEDDAERQRAIEKLQAEKRALTSELRSLEDSARTPAQEEAQVIPGDTEISLDVATPEANGFELVVSTSNKTFVVGVVVLDTDGGLFEGETLSACPTRPSDTCSIKIRPKKNFPAALKLQVHVAARPSSSALHVFEVDYKLPKFCRFVRVAEATTPPSSWVRFSVPTNSQRVAEYLSHAFIATETVACVDNSVEAYYVGLDNAPLHISARHNLITLSTSDLATAAEVVQDICTSLNVPELESEASFPDESQRLKDTLDKVSAHNSIRVRLTAEMADGSSRVKALVLKAEDARLMADMDRMMNNYDQLMLVNEELIAEYNKRAANHEALLAALKQVNQVVQRASQLRVGKAKARVVSEARRAIKKGDAPALLRLIATGRAAPD